MIFISGVISIIFQKNKLYTNKIRAIYFCPNCINFVPENIHFLFFLGGAAALPPCQARAPMHVLTGCDIATKDTEKNHVGFFG